MENKTTVAELVIEPTDLSSIVDEWAQKEKFSLYESTGTHTIYARNVRATKAWLSVENKAKNARIEAWISPKGVGPDFSGSFWKGYKVSVYNGQLIGPVAVYRKQYERLMRLLKAKSKEPASHETAWIVENHSSGLNKSTFVTGLTGLGLISIASGVINILNVRVVLASFQPDFADTVTVTSAFEILFGIVVFVASRLLAKGKLLALWVYGTALLADSIFNLINGQSFSYVLIGFGLLMIWQMFKFKNEWGLA